MKKKNIILTLAMVLGFSSSFIISAIGIDDPDYTETIPPGSYLYFMFNLNAGDILTIEFEVIAGGNKDIDLYIKNSNGDTIENYGRVISGTIHFNAPYDDDFKVYFSNTFSLITSKTVEISFDITYAKSIIIYSPKSTDTFDNGYNEISWSTTGNINYVRIELYKGAIFSEVIDTMEYNDGSYSWYLSSSDTYDGSNYRIKLSDYYDDSIYTFSDYFTIEIEPLSNSDNSGVQLFWWLLIFSSIGVASVVAIALIYRYRKRTPNEIISIEKDTPVKDKSVKLQEKELVKITYCSSCGVEILDKISAFCPKYGAPIK